MKQFFIQDKKAKVGAFASRCLIQLFDTVNLYTLGNGKKNLITRLYKDY